MSDAPKPVVLIVEDEHLIRMMAADAFQDEGFAVLEAQHAAEALLIYDADAHVQVLFTDVNMPGELNGIDLAERLKSMSPNLHVIVTSALPILRPVDHLPATFVSKPYDAHAVSKAALALLTV